MRTCTSHVVPPSAVGVGPAEQAANLRTFRPDEGDEDMKTLSAIIGYYPDEW